MKTEWIDVKDRLPDFDTQVLTFRSWTTRPPKGEPEKVEMIDCGYLMDAITNRSGKRAEWKVGDSYDVDDVTHWMPLPEPPKP